MVVNLSGNGGGGVEDAASAKVPHRRGASTKSSNHCTKAVQELFSNEERYRKKLELFKHYRNLTPQLEGRLRNLEGHVDTLKKLHDEFQATIDLLTAPMGITVHVCRLR